MPTIVDALKMRYPNAKGSTIVDVLKSINGAEIGDDIYRVPGAYTKAGSGISITTFIDSEIIPNKDRIGAYLYGHMSKTTKPVQILLVSIPGETADQITIKKFRWYKIKPM